ncbi:IS200/IS605 family element transposase accessory protein TnpB [Rhizobium laguerreae]|uniref:IS200/IS605 family accessory protein TnpB-related protein n=1 Tax=Rhizobium laguerreae TaxID=1076926 RepID=UPI001C91042F|nr:IS200/IS605 family accessory protein TnpB-related protein [Rhizobium laguerreae]MBY3418327.1 IS200/IS605 family element transposase accessory protein TnpB [Rhizobium laguerreae]
MLAKLRSGRSWSGDLHVSLYKQLGISSSHLGIAYRQLQAKLSSVRESAKLRARDLSERVASKQTDIKRKKRLIGQCLKKTAKLTDELVDLERRVVSRRAAFRSAQDSEKHKFLFVVKDRIGELHARRAEKQALDRRLNALRRAIHQHERKLAILICKREQALKDAVNPSLCFGSKKLFNAQFTLGGSGFANHAQWLAAWQTARSASFTIEGDSSKECGNPFARLRTRDDGLFDLELRLPKILEHLATRRFMASGNEICCIDIAGLSFNHGDPVVRDVLGRKRPVTVRFERDATSWKIIVSVDHVLDRKEAEFFQGSLGIDLNAGHVSAALLDASGNPIETFHIPCVTYGRTSDQTRNALRQATAKVAALAKRHGVTVVAEKLDFDRKRNNLRSSDNPRYGRMLSSFAYSAFGQALESACLRNGVALVRVNPAYTSIIGRVKFARRYGLSVHEAAAITIARRAMGYSERLPKPRLDGTITVPTNGFNHVTLELPVRNAPRHVWSEWSGLNKEYHKRALAAQRSSGRKPRPGWRPKTPDGRSGEPLHGLMKAAGRSR